MFPDMKGKEWLQLLVAIKDDPFDYMARVCMADIVEEQHGDPLWFRDIAKMIKFELTYRQVQQKWEIHIRVNRPKLLPYLMESLESCKLKRLILVSRVPHRQNPYGSGLCVFVEGKYHNLISPGYVFDGTEDRRFLIASHAFSESVAIPAPSGYYVPSCWVTGSFVNATVRYAYYPNTVINHPGEEYWKMLWLAQPEDFPGLGKHYMQLVMDFDTTPGD